jgi:APA family basic amino acid/polyamine antiporter
MTDPTAPPALRRRLGLGLLTLYGVGVMIGAGIYVLLGAVAGAAGAMAPIAFLMAGLVAAPTAISYAELSSRIPESGGEVAYLRDAYGLAWLSRLAGFAIIGGAMLGGAAVLQGGVGYLAALVPAPQWVLIIGLGAALALTAIVGVVESMVLAAVLTVVEVGGLLVVIAAGHMAPGFDAAAMPQVEAVQLPGLVGVGAGALLAFFAFIGFEDMVNMAEETRDPSRTMPRAIFIALAVVTVLYALVAHAAVIAVPAAVLSASDRPLALVMEAGLPQGAAALGVVALAAALNGVLAQMVMAARMLFGLGRDGGVLAVFTHVHPRFGTPALATAVTAAAIVTVALTTPLLALAATSSSVLLVAFFGMNATLLVLKRRGPAGPGVFVAPVWAPWAGMVASAAALVAGWA